MITTATPEQWAEIDRIRQRWIDEQTRDVSFEKVVSVVHRMYARMGKPAPLVLQLDGPHACIAAHVLLYSQLDSQLYSELRSQVRSELRSQLDSELRSQLYSQLYSQLRSQVRSELDSQLDSQLYSQLRSQVRSELRSQLYSQLRSQLELDSQLYSFYVSIWWQAWAGWYEGGKLLGCKFDNDAYEMFRDWCVSVPLSWQYEKLCIVSRFPSHVHWQDGVLHNEHGPSVLFRDGFSLWTIGGIPVDEQIVMRPNTQSISQINSEQNRDVRSIRIDRFGWPEYIRQSGAKCIDQRKNEIEGTEEALFVLPSGERRLMASCPTGRPFVMGIGEPVDTCAAAQKWIHRGRVMLART